METEPAIGGTPKPSDNSQVWFDEGPVMASVYDRESLHAGNAFVGPAIVTQMDATVVIPPGWAVKVDTFGNLIATFGPEAAQT